MKSIILRLTLMSSIFFSIGEIDAQTQQFYDGWNAAHTNYYNYYYSYVPGNLQPCLNEIWYEPNKPYYRNDPNGVNWVFAVYKLLITANQQAGYTDVAESKKQELVNYFYGIMRYEDVMYRLDNTQF